MKSLSLVCSLAVLTFFTAGNLFAQTVDSLGGPYTVDANTIVLLHFDGDTTNAAAAVGKTAVGALRHTTIPNGISFVPNTGVTGMGQCVRINNGAVTDSSFLTLAETTAVDLQGDWTIEAWANILTFGSSSTDWRWVPRIVMKPGQDEFWHPNYWMEMWGDSRTFQTGFIDTNINFISGTSPINMFVPGEWVHVTFVRDNTRGFIVMMVHDANKRLKSLTSKGFDPVLNIPRPNKNPIHMGWAGGILNTIDKQSTDSWLDGYLDEIRISKVVRNFAGPPVITNTDVLSNQPTTVTNYPVTSKIQAFTKGRTITGQMLHYYTTKWDSVAMTGTGPVYSAVIPGQPYGTLVKYYVSARDNTGDRSLDPFDAESARSTVYSFYVYQTNVQTLHLTFEEGPGHAPLDHSPANAQVVIPGRIPDYSTDAKQGTYAMRMKNVAWGDSLAPAIDSNWVEVFSPFLAAEQFCMDVWLKPDTLVHAARIINFPHDSADFFNNNYEIEIRNAPTPGTFGWVGRYADAARTTVIQIQDPTPIVPKQWYHVIWERKSLSPTSGSVALAVRDANDNLQFFQRTDNVPPPTMGGSTTPGARLRVGKANSGANTPFYYIPPLQGNMDDLKIYNYPQAGISGVDKPAASVPWKFVLSQNYPNPFNPTTRISFEIPKALQTKLVVYDILGREVRTIVNEEMHAGSHVVTWDGRNNAGFNVGSGVYMYKLTAGSMSKTQKMMLLK
jgi:hypothetical protein